MTLIGWSFVCAALAGLVWIGAFLAKVPLDYERALGAVGALMGAVAAARWAWLAPMLEYVPKHSYHEAHVSFSTWPGSK